MDAEELHVIDNKQQGQFQILLPDAIAFLEYRWHNGAMALMHTEVPEKYNGKGIAGHLAKYAFEQAKANGYKVMVYCPFVGVYLKRHKEYEELVQPIEK